jgi:hypothetical protein
VVDVASRILFDFVEHQLSVVSEKGERAPAGSKPIEIASGSKPIEGVGTSTAPFIGFAVLARQLEPLADDTWLALGLGSNVIPAEPPAIIDAALLVEVVIPGTVDMLGSPHPFSLCVRDRDRALVGESLDAQLLLTSNTPLPEGWELRTQVPVTMRIRIPASGAYHAEMKINDNTHRQTMIVTGRHS